MRSRLFFLLEITLSVSYACLLDTSKRGNYSQKLINLNFTLFIQETHYQKCSSLNKVQQKIRDIFSSDFLDIIFQCFLPPSFCYFLCFALENRSFFFKTTIGWRTQTSERKQWLFRL